MISVKLPIKTGTAPRLGRPGALDGLLDTIDSETYNAWDACRSSADDRTDWKVLPGRNRTRDDFLTSEVEP